MRITDWKSCKDTLTAKNIKPDEGSIKSLLETSRKKMMSSERLKMDDVTAVSKFSLAYDSLREALEALAIRKGYKIYNHECYTYFLKEIINESSKGDEFGSIRKIRNGVNYYGKNLTPEKSENLILNAPKTAAFMRHVLRAHSGCHAPMKPTPLGVGY